MAKSIVYNAKTGKTETVEIKNFTDEAQSDWQYNYPVRIVAPKTLALLYPEIYVWFEINDLPIEKVGNMVHLYCNEIMGEHKGLIDNNKNFIKVEHKPI